ncbi:MAG TPA: hypothetical protein VEQ63_12060 [Bryobacteraceae bacterium]|nr:hypothetical protein [Bryobacteraceae bacterium]
MLFILYAFIAILVLTAIRMFAGVLTKGLAEMTRPVDSDPSEPHRPAQEGSELKRDPVCGTFVATSTPFRREARSGPLYFCSADCRDKFQS